MYDHYRKHGVGRNPTARLEARYNQRSVIGKLNVDALHIYLPGITPFKSVLLRKESKIIPEPGQDRIKFELFRRLRREEGHKGAMIRLREYDNRPNRTFATVLDLYKPRRINLNRLFQKRALTFFKSKPSKKIEQILIRLESWNAPLRSDSVAV